MASLVKLGVDANACSNEDIAALSEDNDSLREQVISLLLEIEALREYLDAESVGSQLLRYRTRLACKYLETGASRTVEIKYEIEAMQNDGQPARQFEANRAELVSAR